LTAPTATNFASLSVSAASPVARISLRNPPLNVIDIRMMEELAQSLAEIENLDRTSP
jgi:enoyl-CoA hydratase/carnithine racemase